MYADTKFKIIDTKPERDMIHYVWTRLVTLAGKVNMEGELFMSTNLPYTIETLAIEFNRSEDQIKLALEAFIELEMMELVDGRIYRVKNFAKHQNIKVKEKANSQNNGIVGFNNNTEDARKENSTSENCINKAEKVDDEDNKTENQAVEENTEYTSNNSEEHKENICSGINEENKINGEIDEPKLKEHIPISIERIKNKKKRGKKKQEDVINVTDEEDNNGDAIFSLTEGERPIGEGERILFEISF